MCYLSNELYLKSVSIETVMCGSKDDGIIIYAIINLPKSHVRMNFFQKIFGDRRQIQPTEPTPEKKETVIDLPPEVCQLAFITANNLAAKEVFSGRGITLTQEESTNDIYKRTLDALKEEHQARYWGLRVYHEPTEGTPFHFRTTYEGHREWVHTFDIVKAQDGTYSAQNISELPSTSPTPSVNQ